MLLTASEHDGLVGASGDAGATAVAAVRIDERGLTTVDLEDGFTAADLACEALPASMARFIYHPRNRIDLGFRRIDHWHERLPCYRPKCPIDTPGGYFWGSIAHILGRVKSGGLLVDLFLGALGFLGILLHIARGIALVQQLLVVLVLDDEVHDLVGARPDHDQPGVTQ